MDTNKKDTFDSLNSDINLYKDGLEIVEGMLELYKSFFDLTDREGRKRHLIIDYGVNVIERYKEQWIEVFEDILIFRDNKLKIEIREIKVDDYNYIIYGMEKFFIKEYEVFLSSWDLEAATFMERNSCIKNIGGYMMGQSKEAILNFNLKCIKEIIEAVRAEAYIELNNVINLFNRSISIEKDDLKYFIEHEGSIELSIFFDEVNLIRDSVLNKIETVEEKLKEIIEESLVEKTLSNINTAIEEKLRSIIKAYKDEINKIYISNMKFDLKGLPHKFNNKVIKNEELYRRCRAVLEVELNYLQFVRMIGIECLRILEAKAKADFNNVFTREFYSVINDGKSFTDFENIVEGYKIKADFILKNLTIGLLNDFIQRYNEIIHLMLRDRKYRIEKLYLFKPINYMGNFNLYESSEVIHLHKLIYKIYDSYDVKNNDNHKVKEIKRIYIGLDEEEEKSIHNFNLFLESVEVDEDRRSSLQEEKKIVYQGIAAFKDELWSILDGRFIRIFNWFNEMIKGSIEHLDVGSKMYENSINYTDY